MSNVTPITGNNAVIPIKEPALSLSKGPKNRKLKVKPNITLQIPLSHLNSLEQNVGAVVSPYASIFKPHDPALAFSHISGLTKVLNADGSIRFVELRLQHQLRPTADPSGEYELKSYRLLYTSDQTGHDDPALDGYSIPTFTIDFSKDKHYSDKPLIDSGLFIPTNGPALLNAVHTFRRESANHVAAPNQNPEPLIPLIIWCEGEKTRLSVENHLNLPEIKDYFESLNIFPVTSAWLSGMTGARFANLALRPHHPDFIEITKNDEPLDLTIPMHVVLCDNDIAGRNEAGEIGRRLIDEYNVPASKVRVVPPPKNVPVGWDDADELPRGMTRLDRAKMIIEDGEIPGERWILTSKGMIDPVNRANQRKAVKNLLDEVYEDTSTGERVFVKSPKYFPPSHVSSTAGKDLSDTEVLLLAEMAVTKFMGAQAEVKYLNKSMWRETLNTMDPFSYRDTLHEEFLSTVEKGRKSISDDNHPELLFLKTFGLPDTRRHRLIGRVLIRDMVAHIVRNKHNAEAFVPQLIFVLTGSEGWGKSLFCRVLAGASPSQGEISRYTSKVDFSMLKGDGDKAQAALYSLVKGRTIVEFADRAVDKITQTQSGVLKEWANLSDIAYRRFFSQTIYKYNRRFVQIITSNVPQVLSKELGSRRWCVVDIDTSEWGILKEKRDELRQAITEDPDLPLSEVDKAMMVGRNPGLNWLHKNLAAMMAHMYYNMESEWNAEDMNAYPELATILALENDKYQSQDSWEIQFEYALTEPCHHPDDKYGAAEPLETLGIGIHPVHFANFIGDLNLSLHITSYKYNPLLTKRRWASAPHYTNGKVIRLWYYKPAAKYGPAVVNRYGVYHRRTSIMEGYWTIEKTYNLPRNAATNLDEDTPL